MLHFTHTSRFTGKLSIHIMPLESKDLTINIFKNTTFLQIRVEVKQSYKPPKLHSDFRSSTCAKTTVLRSEIL